jgi:hypothetical protein
VAFKPENLVTPGNVRSLLGVTAERYPHMGPNDVRVWAVALMLGLVKFERVEYDVRLGGAGADLVDKEHVHKAMWETLLRKRVDVVGWNGLTPTVIEVKPVAGFAALGQCIGYRYLWRKEKPETKDPRAMCVCAIADPDLASVFACEDVQVVALPPDLVESVLSPRQGA